ncbi:Pkinase-domain-containing protein [Phlebopus sp. FC_14]|nr:Pkinase-domain-containing protein [Phlebopus sp. FC_14]
MATISTTAGGLQTLDITTSKSSSPTSPTTNTSPSYPEQTATSSRSFINLGSPRAQSSLFPITPMSGFTSNNILDPPLGTSFSEFIKTWADTHVAKWLTDIKCGVHGETFREHDIRGDVLLELDQDTLKEMNITSIGDRLRIMNGVKVLRQRCSARTSSPPATSLSQVRTYLSAHGETRILETPREPSRLNGLATTIPAQAHTSDTSHDVSRDTSPTSRAPKRPAPLVLSPNSGRGDLPRLIREPHTGDSARSSPAIRPLPQPAQSGPSTQSATPNGAHPTRPSLPPLPPPPRGQPPQPPTSRANQRNLHPLVGPRARTPNQGDQSSHTHSSAANNPNSSSQNMLTPLSGNPPPNGWPPYGLPSDPRSGTANLKPPIRSPSPLGSRSSPRPPNSAAHNRNISFGGVGSPLGPTPSSAKLPPRPSTTGTSTGTGTGLGTGTSHHPHPYASAQPHPSQSLQPGGQNGPILSPIIESFQSGSSSPSSPSPPAAFTVGRGPFNPSSHNAAPSIDDLRRKLVKFILPDEGRSRVVDVADCAGGIEVMEKVLRKFDKIPARGNDSTSVMNRVETDDGGLSVDGWCIYLEWGDQQSDSGKPLSEAEILAVCHRSDTSKEHGLTLRRTGRTKRSKALKRIFGEEPPLNISPTSPAPTSSMRQSDDEADADAPLSTYASTIAEAQQVQKSKAIKRASTISILSGLGVRDPEKALEPPSSPTQSAAPSKTPMTALPVKKPSKLRNFFGQRPPSELITTHLTEYFPFAEKKALRTARHSMMLRASSISGQGRRDSMMSVNPPLPSRFSTSTQGSGSVQRSMSPARTMSSKRNSVMSTSSALPDRLSTFAHEGLSAGEDPPRVSIATEDGHSVILTGDDVEKLSASDSKPHLLPPVNFPTESLSESMEDLTGSKRLSRTSSNASKRTSFMTELRSKRDRSDTASLLTVDEITAEVENRRQSMAVDMGVEGADDWTKVEPDIDDVTSLSEDTVLEEDDEDESAEASEEEDETGRTMTSSGGTKWIKGALVGAGSFGKVYLGMDAVNGLLMAVKQVELPTGSAPNEERKKSMLSALEREIDLLKDLQHPNIVQYLYSSVDDDYLNIFLEYVPGGSVTALLRSYGAFEEPLVKNFVRQILQGLNYLHERDIIHRDIKGANILVDNKGGIKISDFGISKKVDGNLLTGKRMNRPSLQGSIYWMAPEVVQQKAHTRAADIWSVGCLVVEMLTGEHPWAQLNQMQAIFKIGQSAKPAIPSDISAEAEDFLTKTFDLDHTARPSAGELLQHAWLDVKKQAGSSSGRNNGGAAKSAVPTIEVTA